MKAFDHFTLLFKRQWSEHWRAYLIGAAAIVAILVFLFILVWHWRTSFNGDTLHGIFLILLFGAGSIFMSTMLRDLGDKQKGIWFLILPASALTKISIAFLYGIVIYLVAYACLFYVSLSVFVGLVVPAGESWGTFGFFQNGFYQLIFTFITFQSMILLGSVYFNKSQLLKTLLLIIIGLFLTFNGNVLALKWLTGQQNIDSGIPLGGFQFAYMGENIHVDPPATVNTACSILWWVVVPLMFWVITWYRLKEKEL
ncbi:hypothetical protein [Mucilaginibacter agri]|uniref:Uncharacterized protein n=1 Tax=Mucilaginibacter agri TaxID=2695265 RepID=A0A966DRK4_9SPHI|nr:hypothetical protein [Mucilaginibacter agri]NCD68575.1 hypothetical protein [Mucilaginibacter agri]